MKNPTNTQEYPKGLETEKTEKAWSIKVRERKSFQKKQVDLSTNQQRTIAIKNQKVNKERRNHLEKKTKENPLFLVP